MLLCWTCRPSVSLRPCSGLILWTVWRVLGNVRLAKQCGLPDHHRRCFRLHRCAADRGRMALRRLSIRRGREPETGTTSKTCPPTFGANVPAGTASSRPTSIRLIVPEHPAGNDSAASLPTDLALSTRHPERAVTPTNSGRHSRRRGFVAARCRGPYFAESSSYHRSAEALEHGGALQPVLMEASNANSSICCAWTRLVETRYPEKANNLLAYGPGR